MTFFEGDLLSTELALRNVKGMVATDRDRDLPNWTGHFEVNINDAAYLNNERSYLLLLDNGQSARVSLTAWEPQRDGETLRVRFQAA